MAKRPPTQHHSVIIVDLCEKLEPWFSKLKEEDKENLAAESVRDMHAGQVVKRPARYGVNEIFEEISKDYGTSCRRSFVREALKRLWQEQCEGASAMQAELAGAR